jgi:hypothetical protein
MFDHYSGHFWTGPCGIYRPILTFEAKLCTLIPIWGVGSCFLADPVDRLIAILTVRERGGLQRASSAP